jgi:hypothetical protein
MEWWFSMIYCINYKSMQKQTLHMKINFTEIQSDTLREQSLLMPGGGPEDISKLMVNFSWPLIPSKYFLD